MALGIAGDFELEKKSHKQFSDPLTSDSTSSIQQNTRCPVCLMKFKDPRRLKCEHTFCKSCLQGVLQQQILEDERLSCLICRERVVLPKNGVVDLDTAVYVNDMMEIYQREHKINIKCGKCNGEYCSYCVHIVCNQCEKYISCDFCVSCSQSLCIKCSDEHKKEKGHLMMDIDTAHKKMKDNDGKELKLMQQDHEGEEDYESYDSDDSIRSSQSGFNVVFEVNKVEETDEEEGEFYEEEDEETDSPGSSQSGVNMSYEINRESDDHEEELEDEQNEGSDDDEEEEEEEEEEEQETEEDDDEEEDEDEEQEREEEEERDEEDDDEELEEEDEEEEIDVHSRPPTIIDDVELSDLVNEAIDANLSPEEVLRLRPSAPSNEKRKSVSRIRPDTTHELRLPSSYYEIRSLKWCSRITIGFVIVLTLCTIAFAGLVTAAVILTSSEETIHVFQEALVIVSKPQPFWVESVTITSTGPYDSSYYYETDLYYMNCDRLVINSSYQYNVSTVGTQPEKASDLTVNIPTAPNDQYAYLAEGSMMTFEVYIWSDYTNVPCTSELNIYNNYDEFIDEEGLKAVHMSCLDISKNPDSQPNNIKYRVTKNNFYFVTISVPAEASYRVNIFVQAVTYSPQVIYKEKCTITSSVETLTDECKFKILEDSIVTNTDSVCILADTRPLISSTLSSFVKFSVSSDPNIFRNIAYVVLLLPLLMYLIACLAVWLCFKCSVLVYTHCKNRNARHEYPTDI